MIYFMGICGTAMGNVAVMMRQLGYTITGADSGVYPPMSTVLGDAGIEVLEGFDAERLASLKPDLVVVGNVISRGNPEMEWLLDSRAIPYVSLPEFLRGHLLSKRRNLVVAGTHGKTTTTTMAAFLLQEWGAEPGWLIGGVPKNLTGGANAGQAQGPFVIEGDEYDSAFFDKRSKFIHYCPDVLCLNNLEFDHADIFRDLPDVLRTFTHVRRLVPAKGYIVTNADDPNLLGLEATPWTSTVSVGFSETADVRIADFFESASGTQATLSWQERPWGTLELSLPGEYNIRNAAMALVSAALLFRPNAPFSLPLEPLGRFHGVKRRQDVRFVSESLTVLEDFGHHPTAIRGTLESLRRRFPGARLVAAFEPRSNTARTNVLQAEFTEALGMADVALIGPVNRAERLRADERFDAPAVAAKIGSVHGREAAAFSSSASLLEWLQARVGYTGLTEAEPQVVIFFSNGSFDGIIERFADYCAAAS